MKTLKISAVLMAFGFSFIAGASDCAKRSNAGMLENTTGAKTETKPAVRTNPSTQAGQDSKRP